MTSRIVRVATAALAVGLGGSVQAQPVLTIEPYTFRADDGREVEAELGRFRVPENRATGSDETIELAFVRFASTAPDAGPPIVYLAGGPGGSGTGAARGTRFDLFMALREVGDVVAFDQRGTGLSEALPDCPARWTLPLDEPATRERMVEVSLANARDCVAYWEREGVDLAAYNTRESADDLDALREVLGAEQIHLWGISYGTHLALAAIKRHPERIRRAVLAGVEGPDHTIKRPSDQQALLEEIDRLVRGNAEIRDHLPSVLDALEAVLDRLERQPAMVELADGETVAVGAFDVQRIVAAFLRGPESFASLPAMLYAMQGGDFTTVAYLTRQINRSGGLAAMPAAMDAASGASADRRALLACERGETLLGDAINIPYPDLADALGVPDLGPAFRAPVQSDVPVLLISGTLDGRTPPRNAEEVRAGLPNSAHLVIEGAGHSDPLFLSSPRIGEVIAGFFRGEPVGDETITLPPVRFTPLMSSPAPGGTASGSGDWDRYAGTYNVPGAEMEVTVLANAESLTITFSGQGTFDFFPTSGTTFAMREAAVQVTFVVGEDGEVTGLRGNAQGQAFDAVRQPE